MQILQLHVHDENLPHPKGALLKLRWLWRWLAYSEIIVIFKIKPELIWILWHINLVQAAIRRYTLCMDLVWSSAVLSEMLFCIHCMLKMVIWITAAFLSVQSRTVAHWIFSLFRLLSLEVVVWENPIRSAVSGVSARLPTTITACAKFLKSPFFPIEMLWSYFSRSPWPCLHA